MREIISIRTHKYNERLWQIELKRRKTCTVCQEVKHKRVNEHIFSVQVKMEVRDLLRLFPFHLQ